MITLMPLARHAVAAERTADGSGDMACGPWLGPGAYALLQFGDDLVGDPGCPA